LGGNFKRLVSSSKSERNLVFIVAALRSGWFLVHHEASCKILRIRPTALVEPLPNCILVASELDAEAQELAGPLRLFRLSREVELAQLPLDFD
jgi:hypothetical protein